MNRNTEDLFTVVPAAAVLQFINSRVCDSDVHDGQRSSLMIQLQSVSESPSTIFTLIFCTGVFGMSIDTSDENLIKIPFKYFFFFLLNTNV